MPTRNGAAWPVLFALVACLASAPAARAQVHDRAGFFSPEAVQKADERIGKIKERTGKGIVVDTFKVVPRQQAKNSDLKDVGEHDKFFAQWAQQRIQETKLDGVHILICLSPRHIQVTATPKAEERFSPWSQQHLQRFLKTKVQPPPSGKETRKDGKSDRRQDEHDDGLRDAVAYVEAKLTADRGVGRVVDEAHLFKPETVEKADRQIEQIRVHFGKDLTIATVSAAQDIDTAPYNLKDPEQKREFLDEWVRDRAARLDGIYALICLDPKAVHVVVSEGTNFDEMNRRSLYRLLVDRLQPDNPDQGPVQGLLNKFKKRRNNDEGLLAAVDLVEAKLNANRPVDLTNWMLGMGAIGGLLAGWMVLGVVRLRLRRRTPAGAGVHDADDSGRSIAVLGGGIGAVCGEWLFGHVAAAGKSVARAVVPPPTGGGPPGDTGTQTWTGGVPPGGSTQEGAHPGGP